jgi:hypothetical protein
LLYSAPQLGTITPCQKGDTAMALEKELGTYQNKLQELIPNEGKFVLIHGDQVAGIWETYEDALQAGYQRFGLEPFLVKRIQWSETIQNFTRDIPLCQS